MRLIMKFGGTSVGSADAIRQVVEIVRNEAQQHQVVLVVSAMNAPDLRTTDTLIKAAHAAVAGEGHAMAEIAPQLIKLHMRAAASLLTPAECNALEPELRILFDYISELSRSISILGELTPRALDLISGQGERCNARLIAAALRSAGMDSVAMDATELIITDERFGEANPLMDETQARTRQRLQPLLEHHIIPVVTGFIGATRSGVTTTLGRGGSDYSCAILGASLDADEVWFWKEVDGVMTANPKIVPDAHTLPALSYIEMAELSYYGANILHPKTVRPVVQRQIPIRILNTFNPEHSGTRISADAVPGTAKAVTAIGDVSIITVGGPGMLGTPGVAARIFAAVARAGANTLLISQSSSEQSVCLAAPRCDSAAAVAELRHELTSDFSHQDVEHIEVLEPVVIVAVVGSGMRGTPGIAGKVFGALGAEGINVIAIAQGSTENNISLVVAVNDGDRAVQSIHRVFGM
ncbi:MAG: aspartate kinase [Chloroflexales bacterium]|nr:aspartate kinase [Chloroflexales bacterium]